MLIEPSILGVAAVAGTPPAPRSAHRDRRAAPRTPFDAALRRTPSPSRRSRSAAGGGRSRPRGCRDQAGSIAAVRRPRRGKCSRGVAVEVGRQRSGDWPRARRPRVDRLLRLRLAGERIGLEEAGTPGSAPVSLGCSDVRAAALDAVRQRIRRHPIGSAERAVELGDRRLQHAHGHGGGDSCAPILFSHPPSVDQPSDAECIGRRRWARFDLA